MSLFIKASPKRVKSAMLRIWWIISIYFTIVLAAGTFQCYGASRRCDAFTAVYH